MAGRKGRSGGANRIDPAIHLERGTFRPDRHERPRLAAVAPFAAPQPPTPKAPKPPPALLAHLGPAGKKFVRAAFVDYEVSEFEGLLLHEAGRALDAIAAARADGDAAGERAETRRWLAVLQRCGLPDLTRASRGISS